MSSNKQELAAILMDFAGEMTDNAYKGILEELSKIPEARDQQSGEEYLKRIDNLTSNNELLSETLDLANDELDETKEERQLLRERVNMLENKLESREDELDWVNDELDEANHKNRQLKNKNSKLVSENNSLKAISLGDIKIECCNPEISGKFKPIKGKTHNGSPVYQLVNTDIYLYKNDTQWIIANTKKEIIHGICVSNNTISITRQSHLPPSKGSWIFENSKKEWIQSSDFTLTYDNYFNHNLTVHVNSKTVKLPYLSCPVNTMDEVYFGDFIQFNGL